MPIFDRLARFVARQNWLCSSENRMGAADLRPRRSIYSFTGPLSMDLNLTPAELAFRDAVRAWLSVNIPKDWVKTLAAIHDQREHFEFLRAWQRKVYEGGWAGISWPTEF